MKFEGGCHCDRITYKLDWPGELTHLPARRCGCSYCTRFNGTWTSHPDAGLTISAGKPSLRSAYSFGTSTADFLFCDQCGVIVAALCETAGILRAVVNVNTLTNPSLPFELSESNFEDETTEQRLDRRTSRWIGHVVVQ